MTKLSPIEVHKLLPRTNCRKCGSASCMAFAVKLVSGKAALEECPEISQARYLRQKLALRELLAKALAATPTKFVIHEDKCTGCGNCVDACPANVAISLEVSGGKGSASNDIVLKIEDGVVKVLNVKACRRFEEQESEGRPCSVCIDSCPYKAIEFM